MPIKSRRKLTEADTEMPQGKGYCRRCQKIKKSIEFFGALDLELDKNGLMSVCRDCIDELYELILGSENGSVQKTIFKLCRMLNVKYNESAIDSALKQIETNHSDPNKIFGLYKAKLKVIERTDVNDNLVDLTYKDNPIINFSNATPSEEDVEYDVVDFWGSGYSQDEYAWLENTFSEWKKTHRIDTMSEVTLLKEIVFKQFEIEKARKGGSATASLVKELQDLMKTAALDPTKANIAGAGKSQDTFSSFIKMIEENEPAEYYQDKELFKDYDNIGPKYFEPYVSRPLKNFIVGSCDFNIEQEAEDDGSEEDIFEETIATDLSDNVKTEE